MAKKRLKMLLPCDCRVFRGLLQTRRGGSGDDEGHRMGHSPGNVERDDDREMRETVKCELEHEASRDWVRVTRASRTLVSLRFQLCTLQFNNDQYVPKSICRNDRRIYCPFL